jgi:hypothetical protein
MPTRYKSAQFAPDGEWITDYRDCRTVREVEERLANQGSRWYFYPFPVIIRDYGPCTTSRQRIVSSGLPEYWPDFTGRTLRTLSRFLAALTPEELGTILS